MKLSGLLVFFSGIGALAGSLLCVAGLLAVLDYGRRGWVKRERLPRELRKAKLFLNESELRDSDGNLLRVDQVFQLPSGELVVVDTKTRKFHMVRQADTEQLAKYRRALRQNYDYEMAPYAYIRTVVNAELDSARKIKYMKVSFG